MTKEHLAGIAILLTEVADWLNDDDPGSLDAALLDAAVGVLVARMALDEEPAK